MIILVFLSVFITFLYILFTAYMSWCWFSIPSFRYIPPQKNKLITLIIPVRNEEKNIASLLKDLSEQVYPHFEILIINDNSTDNTLKVIAEIQSKMDLKVHLLHLEADSKRISHKKAAIKLGIENAKGEIIVTTDGDCRVRKNWLRNIHSYMESSQANLVSAMVMFDNEKSLFEKVQTIDFASLIVTGAGGIRSGYPNMCNGANLTYKKSIFLEVGGFQGNQHIASGDDEFLMHKIYNKYPATVKFLKDKDTIVTTSAQPTLNAFFQQRKRWGSKWNAYQNWSTKGLAVFIYGFHLSFALSFILLLFGLYPTSVFLSQFVIKLCVELVFLSSILKLYNKAYFIFLVPLVGIFYPFYILIIGLLTSVGSYEWKGRNVEKA